MTSCDPTEPDMIPSIEYLRADWDTRSQDIHWETAITLAEMSSVAYTVPDNRCLVIRLMGFDDTVILEDGSMSGFVAMTDDVAVVAFRGTDMLSPDDWLANFDFRERLPLGSDREVHRGFQNAYDRFANDAFVPLRGHPFVHGAAERIQILHDTLNRFRGCFDDNGNRTPEGNRIYTDHFTGEKGWFSDSSATEKTEFESELTFAHPSEPGEYLFCSWHGKVKTPQFRIHFSWPVSASTPLYIVYVGPKITKR